MIATIINVLDQATPADPLEMAAKYGVSTLAIVVLAWVVRAWRDSVASYAAAQALAAKESADRAAAAQKECDARNDKTVSTVGTVCDRFSETQTTSARLFADVVAKRDVEDAKRAESRDAMVREIKEDSERREDKLHETIALVLKTLPQQKAS